MGIGFCRKIMRTAQLSPQTSSKSALSVFLQGLLIEMLGLARVSSRR